MRRLSPSRPPQGRQQYRPVRISEPGHRTRRTDSGYLPAGDYDSVLTDVRARQAVARALDRDLMDQRLIDGVGQPTAALLAESSRFYSGQKGPAYDPDLAGELVAEVGEGTGWDGGVTLTIGDGPENVETGVVIKSLLDAVGQQTRTGSRTVHRLQLNPNRKEAN